MHAFLPPTMKLGQGYVFTCVCDSAHRGACMVAGGQAWLPGGMCGCQGACMVSGGHAWLLGGVHGCWGACMVAGGHAWLLWGVHGCQGA